MYMNGESIPENEKKAVDYFMIAAESGIIQAQRIIAQEYVSSDILSRDYEAEAARVWMEKAANQGDAQAQLMLGRYYVSDFGYNDDQKAFEWFEKAAEQEIQKPNIPQVDVIFTKSMSRKIRLLLTNGLKNPQVKNIRKLCMSLVLVIQMVVA